jgi:hypothetical protein
MRNEVNSLRLPPSLPEVAVTLQDSSSATTEINLSVEDENRQLRERNRELETENAIFREGFTRLYGAITRAYSARGKNEKRDVERYARKVEGLQPEDRPGFLASMGEGMIEALAETPATAYAPPKGPDPLRYDIKTLTQRRAEAIAAHLQQTGKSSIKSPEARAVLETVEGRPLDRKTVWRALRALQGILRASKDIIGGVARLIIPSTSSPRQAPGPRGGGQPFAAVGGGGMSPRPRRWAVPWDGED